MHHPSRSPPPPRNTIPHIPLAPAASVAATASRFFVSMRKSFSPPAPPRRKAAENPRAAMYSTPEERHTHDTSRASHSHHLHSRPTIEQIAMGLHLSRTPHLMPVPRPLQRHPLSPCHTIDTPFHLPPSPPSSSAPQHRTRHSLPPPPPRSSMKKTSPSESTLAQRPRQPSSPGVSPPPSVVTSAGSVTLGPSRPLSSFRARVSKFIPGHRPLSFPSSLGRASSITSSASDSTRPTTPRKAVRFSTSILAIDEQP